MFVQDVMTPEPVTVTVDALIKRAVILMARFRVSCLPVVDPDGRLCGVVNEADLIRDAFPRDTRSQVWQHTDTVRRHARLVSEVMTTDVVTAHETTDVADVADLMTARRLKSLPVVDDQDRLVGVVSRSDLVRVRARDDEVVRDDVDRFLCSLGHRDWRVDVKDGYVEVMGPDTPLDRSIAAVAAQTIAGVMDVSVR